MNIFVFIGRFLLVGLLTIGGGLVSIPLLYDAFVQSGFISENVFFYMVSIAESTPGPIAINLSTFIGMDQFGVLGGFLATFLFVIPSIFILWSLYPLYQKHRMNGYLKHSMLILKATVLGIILVSIQQVGQSIFSQNEGFIVIVMLTLLSVIYPYIKKYPHALFGLGALLGIFFLQ
jgi:chromate transporter